ncbi:aminotransferase class V-fold PLP-dependent enzyme [Chitinophaga sp. 22321]|uniref:Aminotransferase class V-fold PLP-dependent enzyme n=1 Tax=Chitinophaga hostae TaxID=2831022 RepID=A0ABS5IW17_9BACT|nr:aminotransferase class V-fold PLP-dependent enzyme [Chitinophaga hostae]MBS0027157.1 aminotransferase class V-fold PLP-dependent enzyme [Chitinophaga hostae]
MAASSALENYFAVFRRNIIGRQQTADFPFGKKKIVYADWTASGRAYRPVEASLQQDILPFWANSHTATTVTGTLMTRAYEEAKEIIKKHVHAGNNDVLLFCGSGMTAAVNKLQRILGWKIPERLTDYIGNDAAWPVIPEHLRPVVFITHMEHHSNQVSWLETIATVEIINSNKNGHVDLEHFRSLLAQYRHRTYKIAAVTACSNVTGIQTPYHEIARMIHEYDGWCFVDFACSAPYVHMNMHPEEKNTHLDAIYFSVHKFLGGPGTPGVLIFNKQLYHNTIPDHPGGGTVLYSNPWKAHAYIADIESREDGGTPPLLQGIKAAMCIRLKEEMGVANILRREQELLAIIFDRLSKIEHIEILEEQVKYRLGVVSFIVHGAHHHMIVKMLNDRFGIQMRGGCSCAGTYGHQLLKVDETRSYEILEQLRKGNMLAKPGWIRLSVHPTMTNAEMVYIMDAIEQTAGSFREWMEDYRYDAEADEYVFKRVSLDKHNHRGRLIF